MSVNLDIHVGIAVLTHKSATHHAVLDIFHSLLAVLVAHTNLAHLLAIHAPHCTTVNISLANPTGSSVIVLPSASRLQYLCFNIACHSGVATSFPKPTRVSNGLVTPLAVAVAVFKKEGSAFTTIVGNTSIPSNGVHLSLVFISSRDIVGICCTRLSSCSNHNQIGLAIFNAHNNGHSFLERLDIPLLIPPCNGVRGFVSLLSVFSHCNSGNLS